MKALHRYILQEDNLVLGMPKIGAGLGGGEWGIISNIIDRVFEDTPVQIWCLKR
jgi:hypothetical protein